MEKEHSEKKRIETDTQQLTWWSIIFLLDDLLDEIQKTRTINTQDRNPVVSEARRRDYSPSFNSDKCKCNMSGTADPDRKVDFGHSKAVQLSFSSNQGISST